MSKFIDLSGHKYGRLFVVDISHKYKRPGGYQVTYWNCVCDCGESTTVVGSDLRTGHTTSCGCFHKEMMSDRQKTHGMAGTRIYTIWKSMKGRCNNQSNCYENYGGRGIGYCESWETFDNFLLDMGESYSDGLELDRIDVDGDYCKDNCRWVDGSLQAYNKRKKSTNTSGRTGVSYHKGSNMWHARISFEKKNIFLGCFSILEDAVKAREEAELKYYGYVKE